MLGAKETKRAEKQYRTRFKYLFYEPIRTDDRIESLGNYYTRDQVLALYTSMLDGKMGMLGVFSMRLGILLRLLYCTPLIFVIVVVIGSCLFLFRGFVDPIENSCEISGDSVEMTAAFVQYGAYHRNSSNAR